LVDYGRTGLCEQFQARGDGGLNPLPDWRNSGNLLPWDAWCGPAQKPGNIRIASPLGGL
jgi:hypothetical protein